MDEINLKNYFNDNNRRIDFILVFQNKILDCEEEFTCLTTFISNLEEKGLHFEKDIGREFPDLTFIKIHGPKIVLENYLKFYNILLTYEPKLYRKTSNSFLRFIRSFRTKPESIDAFKIDENESLRITSTERILIIYKLLSSAYFGNGAVDYGVTKLLDKGVFIAAYPLHSGDWRRSAQSQLTKRRLLDRDWARLKIWYNRQPLHIIERYFGPEMGFYFAFLGLYNEMLVIACIVGILCTIAEITSVGEWKKSIINEVCESNVTMCPAYFNSYKWKFSQLKHNCVFTKLMLMFDNYGTVFFACFMAFWSTIFFELWKRRHAELTLKWNLVSNEPIGDIRYKHKKKYVFMNCLNRREFQENTPYRRKCPVTDAMEAYVPTAIKIKNYFISAISFVFMIAIVLAALFGTIILRLVLETINFGEVLQYHRKFLAVCTGSILNVIVIKMFAKLYVKLSLWLTIKENPRTQQEFEESYIFKIFLLGFVNNYSAMAYNAFVKGKVYTYPGDKDKSWVIATIRGDICHPGGCIMGVCLQLAFVMFLKSLAGNILALNIPKVKRLFNEVVLDNTDSDLPRWEQDFKLKELSPYFLISDYMEMIIQFGSVTFFGAVFPLAPLCALINNLIELRTDAIKYVRNSRRPIPFRASGLAWISILSTMTHIGVICNAFVIAFTSDFVRREIYKHERGASLEGYINSILSGPNNIHIITSIVNYIHYSLLVVTVQNTEFDTSHLQSTDQTVCHYRGQRNPPQNSTNQYQLSSHFWHELCIRFIVAIIFEHILLLFTQTLSYIIPDTPYKVKIEIKQQIDALKVKRDSDIPTMSRGTNVFKTSILKKKN